MKYLKLFDSYHEYDTERRSVEISESNFMRLYHKNCKFHDKNKNIPLYRGTKNNGQFVSIDPRKSIRRSIESENTHVILMSEMWDKFPPYKNSVIGSTSLSMTYGYGTPYELIPYDNSLIALCPYGSIWNSLGGFDENGRIKMLDKFLILIDYDMESWGNLKSDILKYGIRLDDGITINTNEGAKNFLIFYEYFKSMEWKGKDVLKLPERTINSEEELVDIFNSIDPHSLIEFIEWLFDPELLGFEIIRYDENYIDNMNRFLETNPISQIWISNPCLMVRD